MNINSSYSLIELGLLTRWLISVDTSVLSETVQEHLIRFEDSLKSTGLEVTYAAFHRNESMSNLRKEIKKIDKTKNISGELSIKLKKEMQVVEKVLFAESVIKNIYLVPQRRYNGEFLTNNPGKLLKDDIFGKLTDIAKDFEKPAPSNEGSGLRTF